MNTFTFQRPFESHVHGRDGHLLQAVAPLTARQFWGAIFEPNLKPPITTGKQARVYIERIKAATAEYPDFQAFVLGYLTDSLDVEDLYESLLDGSLLGVKFYPRGATTNSDSGIEDVRSLYTSGTKQFDCINAVVAADKVIQLHCELNFRLDGSELDPYDKEGYFFAEIMPRLQEAHPNAKFSCEHLTTAEAVHYMLKNGGPNLGCSITAHHLLHDRRDMFRGGLRPDLFCLPVLKRYEHWEALIALVSGNHSFVYAGTDSAPHDRRTKESDCCSGGVFTAHAAIEFYAEVFYRHLHLGPGFENFVSVHGPKFYGFEPSDESCTLVRNPWTVDDELHYSINSDGVDSIRPHGYSKNPEERMKLTWKLV
ncbi:MAG: Dihydroorotase [Parcubacteria group bacterium]|nr:Dihydroorotase [Parcubacteria group bacterium]